MKRNKFMLFAAFTALLLSGCGKSGRPSFGDNEFPVATIGTQSTELQAAYPATIKGVQDVELKEHTHSVSHTDANVTGTVSVPIPAHTHTVIIGSHTHTLNNHTHKQQ